MNRFIIGMDKSDENSSSVCLFFQKWYVVNTVLINHCQESGGLIFILGTLFYVVCCILEIIHYDECGYPWILSAEELDFAVRELDAVHMEPFNIFLIAKIDTITKTMTKTMTKTKTVHFLGNRQRHPPCSGYWMKRAIKKLQRQAGDCSLFHVIKAF